MNRTVDRGTLFVAYVVLGIGAVVALLPLALMLVSALKTSAEIVANPLALPAVPQWENLSRAWRDAELGTSLLNSAKITGLTVLLVCITSSMAAHALTRERVRGSKWISIYFLATTTLPIQLFLFPLYFGFAKLNLVDSVVATSLIYTAIYSPFSIFLLRTYFLAIPAEVEEAALMDGATPWQVFSRITLPLVSPGIVTVAVISGLNTWNEFLISTTFLQARTAQTAVVRFFMLGGQYSSDWGEIMAAALIIVAPIVVFFLLMQRRFIEGMASGAVKG
jgi:raffinose/stachyose/melibiose transport system permease protein